MQGYFDLTLMDANGLNDNDFLEVQKNGKILDLLGSLPERKHIAHGNLVNHNMAAWCFKWAMGGPSYQTPNISNSYNLGSVGVNGLSFLTLLTTDSEPSYLEGTQFFSGKNNPPDSANASSAGKMFIADAIVSPDIFTDTGGRESVHIVSKFLYLPSEAVSNNIRSIGIFNSETAGQNVNHFCAIFARIRLKDSGGNPTIVTKNSNEVLLVEYTLTFVSV